VVPGPYWLNGLVQTVLVVLPLLAISAVLFLLFEKPFMYRDWPARWRNALRTGARAQQ